MDFADVLKLRQLGNYPRSSGVPNEITGSLYMNKGGRRVSHKGDMTTDAEVRVMHLKAFRMDGGHRQYWGGLQKLEKQGNRSFSKTSRRHAALLTCH